MSEQAKEPGSIQTLLFMLILSCTCAFVLASLASNLKEPQEQAAELDRSKEMLMSAKLFHPDRYFLLKDKNGEYQPAKYDHNAKLLVPGTVNDLATANEIFAIYQSRIHAFLVDASGERKSFEEEGIDPVAYLNDNSKFGYANLPLKLLYEVSPNGVEASKMQERQIAPEAYIFPVNGFGLWDAIYGYLALEPDGNHVRGISWYKHGETPGLGANIALPSWQKQFSEKQVFLEGSPDLSVAPLGISVVRGKVSDVYMTAPDKAASAVDGMPGATLTGNGVGKAYKESLEPYRPFLVNLNKEFNTRQSR